MALNLFNLFRYIFFISPDVIQTYIFYVILVGNTTLEIKKSTD